MRSHIRGSYAVMTGLQSHGMACQVGSAPMYCLHYYVSDHGYGSQILYLHVVIRSIRVEDRKVYIHLGQVSLFLSE